MQWEAELGHFNARSSTNLGQPDLSDPVLEVVGLEVTLSPAQPEQLAGDPGPTTDSNASVIPVPPSLLDFITMSRGAEPVQMLEGVIPSNPLSFVCILSKLVATDILPTPPPSCRRRSPPVSLSFHITHLTKKAFRRAPVVVAAQNPLMMKLSLSKDGQLEAVDFEKYVHMFEEGLSER
jgi:hypothetical protein